MLICVCFLRLVKMPRMCVALSLLPSLTSVNLSLEILSQQLGSFSNPHTYRQTLFHNLMFWKRRTIGSSEDGRPNIVSENKYVFIQISAHVNE